MEMALCPTAPPTACADMEHGHFLGQFPIGYDFAIRNLAEGFPYSLPEFTSCRLKLQLCYARFLAGKIPIEPFLGLNEHREIVLFPGFPFQGIREIFLPFHPESGKSIVFRRKHDPSQGRCVIRYAVHRPLLFSNPIGIFSSPHACRPSWRPVPLPVKDAVPAIRVQDAPHD